MKSLRIAVSLARDRMGYANWYCSFKCMRRALVRDNLISIQGWHRLQNQQLSLSPLVSK